MINLSKFSLEENYAHSTIILGKYHSLPDIRKKEKAAKFKEYFIWRKSSRAENKQMLNLLLFILKKTSSN